MYPRSRIRTLVPCCTVARGAGGGGGGGGGGGVEAGRGGWGWRGYFENGIPFKSALGEYALANYSVAAEETQSNRVSDFRDFVCSSFPKAILFDFYLTYG